MIHGHLCRCYKKETGMTITEYLANLRCTEASRLLKESAYPIEEIAAYVGYLDNNYFVKVPFPLSFKTKSRQYALSRLIQIDFILSEEF